MATFVTISGPSVTGKSSLVDSLCSHREMYDCRFSPDFKDVVWNEISESGIFSSYTDITADSSYICTYLHRIVDMYNKYIEENLEEDRLIILDGCWIDFYVYASLTMWYNRIISAAQEEVFKKILKHKDKISRYYFTEARDEKYPTEKFRIRGKITTFKMNRPLEIQLYEALSFREGAVYLKDAEISGDSLHVIEDLKKVGYL